MPRKRATTTPLPVAAPPSVAAPAPVAAPHAIAAVPKPKRALSAYNHFVKDKYHSKEFEGKSSQYRMAELGKMWKAQRSATPAPRS